LDLARLCQSRVGAFPLCGRILKRVIEERVELLGGENAMPPYDPDQFRFPILEDDPDQGYNNNAFEYIPQESLYPLLSLRSEVDGTLPYISGAGAVSLVEKYDVFTLYDKNEETIASFVKTAVVSVQCYRDDAKVVAGLHNDIFWHIRFENVEHARSVACNLIA
jgi:hypothetical protein